MGWYFVLDIPLFIAGWILLSRRFFFYSLFGRGAYTGRRKKVLLTVVNNYQLKRLEEAVFTIDAHAFFITENTFNVIGKGFSRRRVY